MAGLDGAGADPNTAGPGAAFEGILRPRTIAQFKAIGWIRWRLLVNGLRRKGGKAELAARILFYPFLAVFFIGPILGAGFLGFYAIHSQDASLLFVLAWVICGSWFFVTAAVSVLPQELDVALLLRFPMRFSAYVLLRFTLGLMATPNVVGTLALVGATVGIAIARPSLLPWSALVLLSFALTMILLLRMLLIWLDRWLAQRKTREIVGVFFALFFLGFQYVNYRIQTASSHHHGHIIPYLPQILKMYHAAQPLIAALPASLAARSIDLAWHGQALRAAGALAGLLGYAGFFAALFALRLLGEFRGENFNESPAKALEVASSMKGASANGLRIPLLAPAVVACIEKELLYLKRSPATFISMVTPLVLVAIYAGRLGSSDLTLPGALAYAMFSTMPMLYNVLGQDAAGAQIYLLSPTPIRQIFVAKNIVSSALILAIAGVAASIVVRNSPPPLPVTLATVLWLAFVLFLNLSLGNYRSITAARRADPGKFSGRAQPSQLSVWMVILILLAAMMMGFAVIWTSRHFGVIWVAPGFFLVLAGGAFLYYLRSLRRIGSLVLKQRDELMEGLCKS